MLNHIINTFSLHCLQIPKILHHLPLRLPQIDLATHHLLRCTEVVIPIDVNIFIVRQLKYHRSRYHKQQLTIGVLQQDAFLRELLQMPPLLVLQAFHILPCDLRLGQKNDRSKQKIGEELCGERGKFLKIQYLYDRYFGNFLIYEG